MSAPAEDDWDWVIEPDNDATSKYQHKNHLADAISLGARLSQLRVASGLSEQDVEDFVGIPKADLLAMEAGLLTLTNDMAEQLAMVLNVSVSELQGS